MIHIYLRNHKYINIKLLLELFDVEDTFFDNFDSIKPVLELCRICDGLETIS